MRHKTQSVIDTELAAGAAATLAMHKNFAAQVTPLLVNLQWMQHAGE
jgi:hypothetical protein